MLQWILSSCVLIAVVILLRLLLKGHISLRLQYALWALVLLRLLLPVSFGSSAISVTNLAPAARKNPQAIVPPQVEYDEPSVVDPIPVEPLPTESNPVTVLPQESITPDTQPPVTDIPATETTIQQSKTLTTEQLLGILWLSGAVAVGVWFSFVNLRMHRRLRANRRPVEVADCSLPVYVSDAVDTPCLFGLFCPAIYVTEDCLLDENTLRYALIHEQTHRRHGDHLWSLLRCLCLAVHWYNPLVWWAAILSRRDAELACDEEVLRQLGEEDRAPYGRALLRFTCEKRPALLSVSTTMTGSSRSIRERITMIVKKPKTAVYTLIAVLLVAAIAVGCTFTGAKADTPETQIATPQEALHDLFDAAGEMSLSVRLSDGSFTEPHKMDLQWYALEYEGLLDLQNWTQVDTAEESEEGWYAVLTSRDGEKKLVFHSNCIRYESGATTLCWQTDRDFAATIYANYKTQVELYPPTDMVVTGGTAEEAVTFYIENVFEERTKSKIQNRLGQLEDYMLIDYGVEEISGDGREVEGYVVYAVPGDMPDLFTWSGQTFAYGIGEYEGMDIWYECFLLRQQEESWYYIGSYYCDPLSELPEDQTICQAGDPAKPYISRFKDGLYTISDLDGNVLFEIGYVRKMPEESRLTDSIYKITCQAGTGLSTNWAVFYDGENNRISEIFQYVLGVRDQYVVYSRPEGDVRYIIVQNIFDPAAYKKAYEVPNPSTTVADCIVGMEYDSNGNMVVSYFCGENNEEATVTVELPGQSADLPAGSNAAKETPQAALSALFDVRGEMSICLELADGSRTTGFLLNESRYVDWHCGYISAFDWTAAEASSDVNEDYCVMFQSTDGAHQMKIYSLEIQYSNGEETFVWQGTPRDKNRTSVAGEIRREYDSMEELYVGREWTCAIAGSAEEAVRIYAEQYFCETVCKPLTPGSIYAITDCQVIDWTIFSVSEDGNSVEFEIYYAFMPANTEPDNNPLAAGGVEIDRAEYGGMWTTFSYYRLEKNVDGLWHPGIYADENSETPVSPATPKEAFDLVFGEQQSLRMYLRPVNGESSPVLRTSAPAYYEIFMSIMEEEGWKAMDPDGFSSGDYTVVLLSEDGRCMLSASDNTLLYESEGLRLCWSAAENAWWRAENTVAEYLRRRVFDNEEDACDRISFYCEGTAEDAARRFVEKEYAEFYMNLTEGHYLAYSDYELIEWGIMEVSEDGNAVVLWFEHAFIPENSPLDQVLSGNSDLGTGAYEGMVCTYRQVVLRKLSNGKWYCVGAGTAGMTLRDSI